MIRLNPDCVMLRLQGGQALPCSVEGLTVELIGEAASWMDPEILKNISDAVVHYLKVEQGKSSVTLGEMTVALEQALNGFGFQIELPQAGDQEACRMNRVEKADINQWVGRLEGGFELMLYQRLKDEVARRLSRTPSVLWVHGIRACVKQQLGARRWTRRCQALNDQIVDYIRRCFDRQARQGCSLIVHA